MVLFSYLKCSDDLCNRPRRRKKLRTVIIGELLSDPFSDAIKVHSDVMSEGGAGLGLGSAMNMTSLMGI